MPNSNPTTDDDRYCYVNSAVVPEGEASLSPFDRGFLYGDAIYEVIPAFWGRPFGLDRHIRRFYRSAASAYLTPPSGSQEVARALAEVLDANAHWLSTTAVSRIGVWMSRGVQATDWKAHSDMPPTLLIFSWPVDDHALRRSLRQGIRIVVAPRRRIPPDVLDPRLKMTSRLPMVLAELETEHQGEMPLLADAAGHLTEASSANFFIVRDEMLVTPPSAQVLEGVTRDFVIEYAHDAGLEVMQEPLTPHDCAISSEAFVTSSTICAMPVRAIVPYAPMMDVPGEVTSMLLDRFSAESGFSPGEQAPPP